MLRIYGFGFRVSGFYGAGGGVLGRGIWGFVADP